MAEDVDWDPVVEATEGYAASGLELLAERAAREAMREAVSIDDDHHLAHAVEATESSIADWGDGTGPGVGTGGP